MVAKDPGTVANKKEEEDLAKGMFLSPGYWKGGKKMGPLLNITFLRYLKVKDIGLYG